MVYMTDNHMVLLINASAYEVIGLWSPLKWLEIRPYNLTSFAVCVFPTEKGILFVQN